MARTVLNKRLTTVAPYTIPAGKYAVFAARSLSALEQNLIINGDNAAYFLNGAGNQSSVGPFTAASGDIVSTSGTIAISGFLYDN